MRIRHVIIAAIAGAAVAATSAQASVVFRPTQFNIQSGGGQFSTTPATLTFRGDTSIGGFLAGGPYVAVTGTTPGVGPSSSALWDFIVTGGQANQLVPIIITGQFINFFTTGDGLVSGGISYGLYNSPLTYLQTLSCSGNSCLQPVTQPFTIHTFAQSGFLSSLQINVGGFISQSGVGSFSGGIDPVISFDLASGFDFSPYTLEVAPDAQPPVSDLAVPETATWTMMIAGFGLVGATMRRRRRANTAITATV